METMLPWLHTASAAMAAALVMGVAECIVLTAGVAVALRLCAGLGAGVRSAVWTAALGMCLLLPAGSLLRAHRAAGPVHNVTELGEGWAFALIFVWAVLVAVRGGMLVAGAVRLRQVWRRATPLVAGARCERLLRQGGRQAELCASEDVDRPSVVGFLRPRVLLPMSLLAELSAEEMEHIVGHEMEHLRRRDDWTNLLQKIGMAVFPLNPVLFWLDRRLCLERELACDDGVLRRTRARKAYAVCLANLAEGRLAARAQRLSALALGAWNRETELSRRIHRILSWRESAMGRRSAAAAAGVLMLAVAGGGVELARCPALLQFTNVRVSLAQGTDLVNGSGEGTGRRMGEALAVPVVARVDHRDGGKPMLVQAVLHDAPQSRATGRRSVAGRRSRISAQASARTGVLRKVQMLEQPRADLVAAPRMLLTTWTGSDVRLTRMVFTVSSADAEASRHLGTDEDSPRITAFAVRGGWLFLSL